MKYELGDKVKIYKYYKLNKDKIPKEFWNKYYEDDDNEVSPFDSYIISSEDDDVYVEKYKPYDIYAYNNYKEVDGIIVGKRYIKISSYFSYDEEPYSGLAVRQHDEEYQHVYLVATNLSTLRYVKMDQKWIQPNDTRIN